MGRQRRLRLWRSGISRMAERAVTMFRAERAEERRAEKRQRRPRQDAKDANESTPRKIEGGSKAQDFAEAGGLAAGHFDGAAAAEGDGEAAGDGDFDFFDPLEVEDLAAVGAEEHGGIQLR